MTDTTQPSAPAPAAPPAAPPTAAPSPAQTEVPVQTPVEQPRPLGDQAPPKPEGQESNKSSHISRREALANAFNRAKEAQDEAAKTVPTKREPQKASQKNERNEKQAQQSEKAQQPERYREGGRFARDPAKAQQELPLGQQPQQQQPAQQQQRQVAQLPENAPYREPLKRWSDQTKQDWHSTPESVRGAVHQMAKEFQGAYRKYKADNETMNELRPYHDLAIKQGTSIRRAMDNYYGMEMKLRQDLVGGLDVIVQNVARSQGLVGPHGGPLNLRDVMQHVLTMTPEQQQLSQQRNLQASAEQQLGAMQQQVQQQQQVLNQILYQQKFTYTRSQVDQFAETHPRFDELAEQIKRELEHGYSLEVAYKRAELLRPAHAAQTRTQSAQTRKTSISGAPNGSGNAGNTRPSDGQRRMNGETKHPSRREALARAFRRVGGGV
jgi:hypothetical protein